MRKTLYGTLTYDDELNENEKAMLYIKECAESVGMEVIEGETAFTIQFMAKIMRKLRAIIKADTKGMEVIDTSKTITVPIYNSELEEYEVVRMTLKDFLKKCITDESDEITADCWECENKNTQMCEGCKDGYMDGIDGWVQYDVPTHFIPKESQKSEET